MASFYIRVEDTTGGNHSEFEIGDGDFVFAPGFFGTWDDLHPTDRRRAAGCVQCFLSRLERCVTKCHLKHFTGHQAGNDSVVAPPLSRNPLHSTSQVKTSRYEVCQTMGREQIAAPVTSGEVGELQTSSENP